MVGRQTCQSGQNTLLNVLSETHISRLSTLVHGALHPEPGLARIALALSFGLVVHLVFTVAALSMVIAVYFGSA